MIVPVVFGQVWLSVLETQIDYYSALHHPPQALFHCVETLCRSVADSINPALCACEAFSERQRWKKKTPSLSASSIICHCYRKAFKVRISIVLRGLYLSGDFGTKMRLPTFYHCPATPMMAAFGRWCSHTSDVSTYSIGVSIELTCKLQRRNISDTQTCSFLPFE